MNTPWKSLLLHFYIYTIFDLLYIEINDTVLVSHLIVDIIICKDEKEKLQIIDKICYLLSEVVYITFHRSLHSTQF